MSLFILWSFIYSLFVSYFLTDVCIYYLILHLIYIILHGVLTVTLNAVKYCIHYDLLLSSSSLLLF